MPKFLKRFLSGPECSGFTLIELIIVIGISVVLSSILFSYNHTTRQQLALYAEEMKFVQTVFRAKSLALASYIQSSNSNICGYGIHIDYLAMNYSLFSYNKPNGSNCKNINSISVGSENIVSTFTLDPNVKFISSPAGLTRLDDVLFIPPDPLTIINSSGNAIISGLASVVIQTQDNSLSARVNVNSAGLIDFR
ncbi:MAG: type II secretion system protein [bacterium]|nr:type II secretion system protein [bacterium]